MSEANVSKILKDISSQWFLEEPLLFSILCIHNLIPNDNMSIPFRSGQLRIEYAPKQLESFSKEKIASLLKIELYRILLQHPYSRQPLNCQAGILLIASDVTIYSLLFRQKIDENLLDAINNLPGILYLKNQAVRFSMLEHPLGIKWIGSPELHFFQRNLLIDSSTGMLQLYDDLTMEQWYSRLFFLIKETSISGENVGSYEDSVNDSINIQGAELWEENQEAQNELKNQIQKAEAEQGWGGLGGSLSRSIKDNCDFSFDYRKALTQFRQNIVSTNRKLTRMRPNRRYGFKVMGSRYEQKANILIAVDVSGSITDESFEHFYHAINNFFYLRIIEKIDLIFFDVNLKNTKPISFHKKVELKEIKGRGGTNFQPAIDFYFENTNTYDGMIIFTDGEGNIPTIQRKSNILWILDSRMAFEKNKQWINNLSGCKCTYLPF